MPNGFSQVWEARKKARQGNKWLTKDLWEHTGKTARGNIPELPHTSSMVVILRVPNGDNDPTSCVQFQAWYTDVSHWEKLIDFNEINCNPKEPYCLTALYKWNFTKGELEEEYMWIYAPGQMMNDPLYGQISYTSSLSNAFKLKLGHNVHLLLVEMKADTRKDIGEHIIRPVKVIPTSLVPVSYANCEWVYLDFRGIRWKWTSGGWAVRWDRYW